MNCIIVGGAFEGKYPFPPFVSQISVNGHGGGNVLFTNEPRELLRSATRRIWCRLRDDTRKPAVRNVEIVEEEYYPGRNSGLSAILWAIKHYQRVGLVGFEPQRAEKGAPRDLWELKHREIAEVYPKVVNLGATALPYPQMELEEWLNTPRP